jgi:molybdopterin-guanine dinucleotide biosynthesis protein A
MGARVQASAQITAIVVAGGQGSRMGRSKAMLDFGGEPMIARIVRQFRRRFDDVVIVAAPESVEHLDLGTDAAKIICDETAFQGPVDALRRGLGAVGNEIAFACSCDLPLLNADVAVALLGLLDNFDAVIPEIAGRLQPLHAVYRTACAAALQAMAVRGEKRLVAIADAVRTRRVAEPELRAIDPELLSFVNINTPEDYARAQRLAGIAS